MKAPLVFLLTCAVAAWAADPPGVLLQFRNLRPDATTLPVFITFGGTGKLDGTNLATGVGIRKGLPYLVNDLSSGVRLASFEEGGRIFVSFGVPLATATVLDSSNPNFADPTKPDFSTRWDQIAIRYTAGTGGASLSSDNFFGIPLQIETRGGGLVPSKLSWHTDATEIFRNLTRLAGYSLNTVNTPEGAVVQGRSGVVVDGIAGGPVVRVIGPGAVNPLKSGGTVYPGFAAYKQFLRTRHRLTPGLPVKTILAGHNGIDPGTGKRQTYQMECVFAQTAHTLKGAIVNAGDIVMSGFVNQGGTNQPLTLLVRSAALTDSAISRTSIEHSLLEGTNPNHVAARITTDFLTGMNLGFVGSAVDNPAMPGVTVGESPSWTWFGNKPDGSKWPALNGNNAFAAAQPNDSDHYNRYASYLAQAGDSYALPAVDRLQVPVAPLAQGTTLTLNILSDSKDVPELPGKQIAFANAATYVPNGSIAPGSLAVAWGALPTGYQVYAPGVGVPVGTELPGLRLRFNNGKFAPLLSANSQVAAFQVPWEIGDTAIESAVVIGPEGESSPFPMRISAYAPALFAIDQPQLGQGHIYHLDGTLADAAHPAVTGEEILIYCTGLGPVHDQPASGTPGSIERNQRTLLEPTVNVGGIDADVAYSGLAPLRVGYYEVRVRIPPGGRRGDSVAVKLRIGGAASNSVTMTVCDFGCPVR